MEFENNLPVATLLALSSVALFVGSRSGFVVACNDAAASLLGRSPSEIIGQEVTAFDTGRSARRVAQMHGELATGNVVRSNTAYLRGDGSYVVVETEVVPCLWNDELHFLGIVVPLATAVTPLPAIDAFSQRGGMLVRCAWCDRVLQHPGKWVASPIDHATIPISHGICPECYETSMPGQLTPGSSGSTESGGRDG